MSLQMSLGATAVFSPPEVDNPTLTGWPSISSSCREQSPFQIKGSQVLQLLHLPVLRLHGTASTAGLGAKRAGAHGPAASTACGASASWRTYQLEPLLRDPAEII